VIGRITEVAVILRRIGNVLIQFIQVQPKRWKVDANSRQDAILMLSSVNLPGGVQVVA
jgi:exosome complex component RRP4